MIFWEVQVSKHCVLAKIEWLCFKHACFWLCRWSVIRGNKLEAQELTLCIKLAFPKWKCSLCAINGNVNWIKLKPLGLKLKSFFNTLIMDRYTSYKDCKARLCSLTLKLHFCSSWKWPIILVWNPNFLSSISLLKNNLKELLDILESL